MFLLFEIVCGCSVLLITHINGEIRPELRRNSLKPVTSLPPTCVKVPTTTALFGESEERPIWITNSPNTIGTVPQSNNEIDSRSGYVPSEISWKHQNYDEPPIWKTKFDLNTEISNEPKNDQDRRTKSKVRTFEQTKPKVPFADSSTNDPEVKTSFDDKISHRMLIDVPPKKVDKHREGKVFMNGKYRPVVVHFKKNISRSSSDKYI